MYQINTLQTLKLHNIICQLFLNKARKKKQKNWAQECLLQKMSPFYKGTK